MKKKILLLLMSAMLVFSLTACQGNATTSADGSKDVSADNSKDDPSAQKIDKDLIKNAEDARDAEDPDAADAAEAEPDSTGDSKTENNKDSDDSDLDDELDSSSLGPVFFAPSSNSETGLLARGGDTLHAYFKRTGVKGNGRAYVYANNDMLYCELDLSDPDICYEEEDDGTFAALKWSEGTHLMIVLPEVYENSGNFYVLMDEGAFTSEDGKIKSREVKDDKLWRYNVQNFGLTFFTENGSDVYVGEEVFIKVLVRAPAKKVVIDNFDVNRLSFNEKEFRDEDGDLKVKINQIGEDSFDVKFYNSERELISVIPVTYHAEIAPDPEEQTIRDSIVGL